MKLSFALEAGSRKIFYLKIIPTEPLHSVARIFLTYLEFPWQYFHTRDLLVFNLELISRILLSEFKTTLAAICVLLGLNAFTCLS